ncbi:MAG TPA: TlpA disulfide reductase family protein [Vicinamibacterales bacterium]|nr:TlpA disulfide reductase family protein [Vicinamibacterales bacterium]
MKPLSTRARWILAAALAVALGFAAIPAGISLFGHDDAAEEASLPAGAAPTFCDAKGKPANLGFTVKDMNGRDLRMSDYKGKVILLNFWATWCGPCKVEIPGFIELYDKYKNQGFAVLGLSTDDAPEQLRKFAQNMRINYPVLVASDRNDIIDDAYGPMWGIPVSFLIAKDGTICRKYLGLATKEQLERELKALLAI